MFRKITAADEAVYTELLREFYHSPAVLHPIPEEYYHRAFEEAVKDSHTPRRICSNRTDKSPAMARWPKPSPPRQADR